MGVVLYASMVVGVSPYCHISWLTGVGVIDKLQKSKKPD